MTLIDCGLLIALANLLVPLANAQSALICEDSINSQTPFDSMDGPCLLGCGSPVTRATGSLLPGSVNETDIPYCELNCVRKQATPAQSSAAPACNQQCRQRNSATPEQLDWCMYWCVEGGSIAQSVVATTCVPSLEYIPVATSTIQSNFVVTIEGFTHPAEWQSWYQTQTAITRTSQIMSASTEPSTTSAATKTSRTPNTTTASGISTTKPGPSSSSTISENAALGVSQSQMSSAQSQTPAATSSSGGYSNSVSLWTSAQHVAMAFVLALGL